MFEVGWLVNHTRVVIFTYNFGCSHIVLAQGWVGRTSQVPTAVAGTAVAQGIALPLGGARFDPHRCGGSIDSEKRVKRASHGGRSIPLNHGHTSLPSRWTAREPFGGGDTTRANGRQPWCPNRVFKTPSACGISGPAPF